MIGAILRERSYHRNEPSYHRKHARSGARITITLKETLHALEKAGTAQNQKIYARHGVLGPMYGVSYAELGKLKKRIKIYHALAVALW